MHSTSNVVVLQGTLSSEPRTRVLPSGDELVSYEITTETAAGRASAPVVWFSPRRPPAVHEGDDVVAVGVIRRRFFRAGGGASSRTEVVADIVARSDSRRAQRALDAVRGLLADGDDQPASEGSPQRGRAR